MDFVTKTDPEARTCFVFLDLEETVINNWEDQQFLLSNIDKIEEKLNGRTLRFPPLKAGGETIESPAAPIINLRLGLMSWAVWDEKDKQSFNKNIRPHLETMLRRRFDDSVVWSMDDWADQLLKYRHKKVDRADLFDLLNKPEVLFMLMNKHPEFKNSFVFLIDDAFEHQMHARSFDWKCSVEINNINHM